MKSRKYKGVIFDLDGTLLDTLTDLTNSTNAVMDQFGFPNHTKEAVRQFVGNGIARLLEQAIPAGRDSESFDAAFEAFKEHYGIHCMDETKPYPGIMELLKTLKQEGVKTAIVSNKADFAVKKLNQIYFEDLIPVAIGEKEDCRKKPAPDSVWKAMKELGLSAEQTVYVGDSDVDIMTAKNAGLPCIAVSWGFRDQAFLIQNGAKEEQIAANVQELDEML